MSNTTAPDATNSWEDTEEETAEAEFELINLDKLSKKPKHTAIEIEITSIVNTVQLHCYGILNNLRFKIQTSFLLRSSLSPK